MKQLITAVFILCTSYASAQCIGIEDSVFSNTVTLITATTARVNGDGSNGDVAGNFIKLRYVRVGQTDTVTSTTAWPTTLRNLTGLQAGTQYVYYYSMNCGDGDVRQIGRYYFTTLTQAVVYATERSTVMPYYKADSGIVVPRIDTALYRQPSTTGGNIVFRPADSTFYGYNKARWVPLMASTSGIINKVDSVIVSSNGDSLFYWINGTSYGQIFNLSKWDIDGNSGTTAGTNFIGTTDNVGLMFKVDNTQAGYIDQVNQNLSFGYLSMASNVSGSANTSFGSSSMTSNLTGTNNVAIGRSALQSLTSGDANTSVGTSANSTVTSGDNNTSLGYYSLFEGVSGSGNIAIGSFAGKNQTNLSNRLYISSLTHPDILGDTTKSIIYGYQDATAANQRLYLNSQVYLPYAAAGAGTKALRINPGTGIITYADTSTATATSPAGNYGNVQLNRNGVFATPASDSLSFVSGTGLNVKGSLTSSTLTATRVPYISTSGLIVDNANHTFVPATSHGGAASSAPTFENPAFTLTSNVTGNNGIRGITFAPTTTMGGFTLPVNYSPAVNIKAGGWGGTTSGGFVHNLNLDGDGGSPSLTLQEGTVFAGFNMTGGIMSMTGQFGAGTALSLNANNARVHSTLYVGGGTNANSTLQVNGSVATAYRAITALRTLDATDYTIEVTANTFTVTLPTAVGITGRIYVITNSGSGTTTVGTTSSQTFANVLTTPTTLTLAQYSTVMVQSNGANWLRLTSL